MRLYAGVESGGTKFVCVVGTGPDDIRDEIRFPTTMPDETLHRTVQFFADYLKKTGDTIDAVGVASFGPLDLNPESPWYGYITSTPKPGWKNAPIVRTIQDELKIPVNIDTDVNGAALAEQMWGCAQGKSQILYITIGTGIGGGAVINGKPVHGLIHPEMGHIRLPHDFAEDPFLGSCPFHQDCFEGLASGPAVEKRWGVRGENLPESHPAWQLEAHYIALGLQNLICSLSPEKIILGGGIMQKEFLFPMIRQEVKKLLAGYVESLMIGEYINQYIVPPGLGNRAGVLGALALAQQK